MKHAYLTIRLAFEALIGVLLLFKCAIAIFPEGNSSIATIVGALLGLGLTFDAFRIHRMLNLLDAALDPPQD
jgi:hypothetical protein